MDDIVPYMRLQAPVNEAVSRCTYFLSIITGLISHVPQYPFLPRKFCFLPIKLPGCRATCL